MRLRRKPRVLIRLRRNSSFEVWLGNERVALVSTDGHGLLTRNTRLEIVDEVIGMLQTSPVEVPARPCLYVATDHNPDEVRAFYEVPEALATLIQPIDDPRTFAQCLADATEAIQRLGALSDEH